MFMQKEAAAAYTRTVVLLWHVTSRQRLGAVQGPSKITKHVEREVISHSNFCHVSFVLPFAAKCSN